MNVKVRGVDSYLYLSVQSDLSPSSTFLILSSGTVKGLLGNMGGDNSESGYNIYGYLISLLAIVIVRRYDSNHLFDWILCESSGQSMVGSVFDITMARQIGFEIGLFLSRNGKCFKL